MIALILPNSQASPTRATNMPIRASVMSPYFIVLQPSQMAAPAIGVVIKNAISSIIISSYPRFRGLYMKKVVTMFHVTTLLSNFSNLDIL
jgi:hypothetical protein